jgi:hypothetical protein
VRAYTVTTVAVALDVPSKWVDNILSHHTLPGVTRAHQGIPRRLNEEAVIVLELVLRLREGLALPAPRAVAIAATLVKGSRPLAHHTVAPGSELIVDIDSITRDVRLRLADAVESAPVPVRGRPPQAR